MNMLMAAAHPHPGSILMIDNPNHSSNTLGLRGLACHTSNSLQTFLGQSFQQQRVNPGLPDARDLDKEGRSCVCSSYRHVTDQSSIGRLVWVQIWAPSCLGYIRLYNVKCKYPLPVLPLRRRHYDCDYDYYCYYCITTTTTTTSLPLLQRRRQRRR